MTHYFTNDSKLSSLEKEVKVEINDQTYSFVTDNGVFSKKGLDFGTRSLLACLPLERLKGKILDFGCGYGPIGIYASKNTDALVDMVDVNKRSVALAKKNALLNKVNVNVFESDIYNNVTNKYNFIITNPPIRVGKKILYEILFEAKRHLLEDGELWLVINKDQGAKTVVRDLGNEYTVQIVDKNKGFYIICARND